MKINILGTEYSIQTKNEREDPKLKEADGYCDTSTKEIIIRNLAEEKDDPNSLADLDEYKRKVIRHEIIHAMFYESGLSGSSGYQNDETLVDWIAIQIPKLAPILKECEKVGVYPTKANSIMNGEAQ